MENVYILVIIALVLLAIADLVVGVSNDAVNFLTSAIGSKAISFKTIMIVASLGIALGVLFSSGLMEVARKGIFNPSGFYFDEIIIIFSSVMIADVLLLHTFNSLGLPTSTTVSIVFSLLGAAFSVALIKMNTLPVEVRELENYINFPNATKIILGIFLSVFFAFTIGAIVQFVSRLILSFKFENRPYYVNAFFGGIAISAITSFVLIKGLKNVSFISMQDANYIKMHTKELIILSFVFWTIVSWLYLKILKKNIYKLIIAMGTFSLAMAFAGNDLVNFIGVPVAAFQSYEAWVVSGIAPESFSMSILNKKTTTPLGILMASAAIMILTLWFSKKARLVTETEINLARQGRGKEKFKPTFISKTIVKNTIKLSEVVLKLIPSRGKNKIETQYIKPQKKALDSKNQPAFDMVRASVNLMLASILISIATSMKLPLSTTYVTFMVAMGTSFADRAWGADSAVYRVAGVLNVIGGWFLTAFIAFLGSGFLALLVYIGGNGAISILLIVTFVIIFWDIVKKKKTGRENVEEKSQTSLSVNEIKSIQEVLDQSVENVFEALQISKKVYSNCIDGLLEQKLSKLKKTNKTFKKLHVRVKDLRDNVFYFIKELEDTGTEISRFYIITSGTLEDMLGPLNAITNACYKYVDNSHKKINKHQAEELQTIKKYLVDFLEKTSVSFKQKCFEKDTLNFNNQQVALHQYLNEKLEIQIERTRKEEHSPKKTALYFKILLETKTYTEDLSKLFEQYRNMLIKLTKQ